MDEEIRLGCGRTQAVAEKLLPGLIFGCFALMAAMICAVSLFRLLPGTGNVGISLACVLLGCGVAAAVAGACWNAKEIGGRRFLAVLFLATLVLKGTFAVLIDTRPETDLGILYGTAVWFARSGHPMTHYEYFRIWPYQSGFVLYMAALIRFLGADILFLKLTNALYSALTGVLVYALAKRFASEGGARAAGLLYSLYPGTWLLLPVLTNQHLSEVLFMGAIYIYTTPARGEKKRLALAGAAGACLALANAIRPVAVVALAAAGCMMVLEMLHGCESGRNRNRTVLRFILLAAVYAGLMAGFSGLVRATGANEYGLGSSCPEWKFACGLNESTCGIYSDEDSALIFGSENPRQTARELALDRIKIPPDRLARLFREKVNTMWGTVESLDWMLTKNVMEQLERMNLPVRIDYIKWAVQWSASGLYAVCFLLAAAGGVAVLRTGACKRETAQLLALSALAYFGAHLLIEIQPRYRSLMLAVAFPLIGAGLDGLWELWRRRSTTQNIKNMRI